MSKTQTIRREVTGQESQDDQNTSLPELHNLTAELTALLAPNAPLNKNEMNSIKALIAYTAHVQNVAEETVASILAVAFGVSDVAMLPNKHYDAAVRYLVDLKLSDVVN